MDVNIGGIVDQLKSEGYTLDLRTQADGTIVPVFPDGTTDETKQAIRARVTAIKASFDPPTEAEVRTFLATATNAKIALLVKELLVPLLMRKPALWRTLP